MGTSCFSAVERGGRAIRGLTHDSACPLLKGKTQIQKYTNTQIHQYANTQIHKRVIQGLTDQEVSLWNKNIGEIKLIKCHEYYSMNRAICFESNPMQQRKFLPCTAKICEFQFCRYFKKAVERVDFIILRESLLNSEMESDKLLEVLKHVSTLFIKSTH